MWLPTTINRVSGGSPVTRAPIAGNRSSASGPGGSKIMVTLSQLFTHTSAPHQVITKTVNNPALSHRLPGSVLLPRKGNGHHPHPHHLPLVTHPELFDWSPVAEGDVRASLVPRSHSGARQIAVTVGADVVGTLESLPAALLYDWVEKLNNRGYEIQLDTHHAGNDAQPQLLTKSASSVANYLHILLEH